MKTLLLLLTFLPLVVQAQTVDVSPPFTIPGFGVYVIVGADWPDANTQIAIEDAVTMTGPWRVYSGQGCQSAGDGYFTAYVPTWYFAQRFFRSKIDACAPVPLVPSPDPLAFLEDPLQLR